MAHCPQMLLPYAVQIGVVMYIYEGYKGGGRAIKGRARDKITLDVTHIICHIHFKLTRLTVQAQIPSSVTYFMEYTHSLLYNRNHSDLAGHEN